MLGHALGVKGALLSGVAHQKVAEQDVMALFAEQFGGDRGVHAAAYRNRNFHYLKRSSCVGKELTSSGSSREGSSAFPPSGKAME